MSRLAIIGGSGLNDFPGLSNTRQETPKTDYGSPSGPIFYGEIGDREVVFLARHGVGHTIPPHKINYRANIAALAALGIENIVAVTAVGGICREAPPMRIVIPDQIIDYTYGREHTYFDGTKKDLRHIDFSEPFTESIRACLIASAKKLTLDITTSGTYGATQGPRLETPAEIRRMSVDGCTIVGMTAMPEAALARELGMNYANSSLVVNWAAGVEEKPISIEEINRNASVGMKNVLRLLETFIQEY